MSRNEHRYLARLVWEGNRGEGTWAYDGYDRQYRILIAQKPDITGSADPHFRGDAARHNPEDLFLASVSACHMLTYLALCARQGVRVLAYDDSAVATLRLDTSGGGCFDEIELRPTVTVASARDIEPAERLHRDAHQQCFIATSCRVPIRHRVSVRVAEDVAT